MSFLDGIGPAIRLLRKRSRMTQKDLATAAQMSKNLLSNWETGATHPSVPNLERTLGVLGADLLDLHNTIQLLHGRPARRRKGPNPISQVQESIPSSGSTRLIELLEKAPEVTLWVLQLLSTLQDPEILDFLRSSLAETPEAAHG